MWESDGKVGRTGSEVQCRRIGKQRVGKVMEERYMGRKYVNNGELTEGERERECGDNGSWKYRGMEEK